MSLAQRLLSLLLVFVALSGAAHAHEVRPAYLAIREVESDTYDIVWKTPAQGDLRLALNVVFPETCESLAPPRVRAPGGAVIASWREHCPGGLIGQTIAIDRLDKTLTDTLFRLEPLGASPQTFRLTPDKPFIQIPARQNWMQIGTAYFGLGVEHILMGVDHLLFVLAILLLVGMNGRLLAAVTSFTVAHSLTLVGTSLGWVRLPVLPVEATIALSIAFVAAEGVRARSGQPTLTQLHPWIASFAFGLLHGFGFAGALREIGLPEDAVPLALFSFNLGVEAGQLLFIGAVLIVTLAVKAVVRARPIPAWAQMAPQYLIGICGAFWFVERVARIVAI
ncbi:MAG: HupE/UreJ family protein [Hyphomonadaceae bacterium]